MFVDGCFRLSDYDGVVLYENWGRVTIASARLSPSLKS